MRVLRIIPNLRVSDTAAANRFYAAALNLTIQDDAEIVHPMTDEPWASGGSSSATRTATW